MDRRSFLKLVGAVGVSLVVPELWTPSGEAMSIGAVIKDECRVSGPADRILDIILCGKSLQPEVGTFDIVRPDGNKILALALNTYGGILRWVAAPGEELITPLQFVYSGNMTVNVIGMFEDRVSYTVFEPGRESPVIIPVMPTWESNAALGQSSVPDIFRTAWDGK